MKSNGFLITGLDVPSLRKSGPRKSTVQTRTSRSIEQTKLNSAFVIKNEKTFNETKKTMIEFLINDETQYVDLFKCHEFYEQMSYKNNNLLNINQNEIKKKRKRLAEIQKVIESEVLSNLDIKKEEVDKYYSKIIRDLENVIEHQKKDIENYNHQQQDLIDRSNSTKEKINNIYQLEDKNQTLFEKYQLVKEHAQNAFKRQKTLLSDLMDYDKRFGEVYEEGLKNKKSKFKELEYQVFKIKNSTVTIQNKLEELKSKITSVNDEIKDVKRKNIKINDERKTVRREFMQTKVQLLQIFKRLQFKTLDDIIALFNTESKDYQNQFAAVLTQFK